MKKEEAKEKKRKMKEEEAKKKIEKVWIKCLAWERDNKIAKFLSQGFCGVCYSDFQLWCEVVVSTLIVEVFFAP